MNRNSHLYVTAFVTLVFFAVLLHTLEQLAHATNGVLA